jgi:hypothetical protein
MQSKASPETIVGELQVLYSTSLGFLAGTTCAQPLARAYLPVGTAVLLRIWMPIHIDMSDWKLQRNDLPGAMTALHDIEGWLRGPVRRRFAILNHSNMTFTYKNWHKAK